jgi:hypothetical protein
MTGRRDDETLEERRYAGSQDDDPGLARAILETVAQLIGWSGSPTALRDALKNGAGSRRPSIRWAKARAWLAGEVRRVDGLGGSERVLTHPEHNRDQRIIADAGDTGPRIVRFTQFAGAKRTTRRGRSPKKIRPA